uniref:Uncharacterized protein n=1 Tax=Peronospora matthiolae TaxID=2874970 RepID=A0AAV1TQ15_9STRA
MAHLPSRAFALWTTVEAHHVDYRDKTTELLFLNMKCSSLGGPACAHTVIAKTRSSDVRYCRSLIATTSSVSACESKRAKLDIAPEESSWTKAKYSSARCIDPWHHKMNVPKRGSLTGITSTKTDE